MTAKNRFWLRRFRSSSFSSELDVDQGRGGTGSDDGRKESVQGNAAGNDAAPPRKPRGSRAAADRYRAVSTTYNDRSKPVTSAELEATLAGGLERLRLAPHAFPFQALTEKCKLIVFSLLSPAERGRVASVCKEWSSLMRTPSIWSDVDLISFPPYPTELSTSGGAGSGGEMESASETALAAYESYRRRTIKFMSYLVNVRPALVRVRFAFDIADVRDGWLDILQTLFRACQCADLEYAELNWNETPVKPYVPENSSATWCTNDYKDLMYRHRQRQRFFVKFFDFFTASAGTVSTLILPFDWTERSLRALNRLPNLDVLVLNKYFVFQSLEQSLIDTLFRSAPFLRHLTMEVWTPSGRGLQLFTMRSETLEMLDVSACRGFYLESVELPLLRVFKVSICPMNGPLVSSEGFNIACLHDTLRTGAPNLIQINEYQLLPTWKEATDDTLEAIFKSVCACGRHTSE